VEKVVLVEKAAGAVEDAAVGRWLTEEEGRWVAALERGGERGRQRSGVVESIAAAWSR
jgi:hypothetical protein